MLPGRDMARIALGDILAVVREEGETGSHRHPKWDDLVESLCVNLDDAVKAAIGDMTLADLLDQSET